MAQSRPDYRQGRIVWAYLRTRKGKRELHPAVILTPDDEIVQPRDFDPRGGDDNVVVVAGISTKYSRYADSYVRLPFQPTDRGHPLTKLRKDSAVIVGWYDVVTLD